MSFHFLLASIVSGTGHLPDLIPPNTSTSSNKNQHAKHTLEADETTITTRFGGSRRSSPSIPFIVLFSPHYHHPYIPPTYTTLCSYLKSISEASPPHTPAHKLITTHILYPPRSSHRIPGILHFDVIYWT